MAMEEQERQEAEGDTDFGQEQQRNIMPMIDDFLLAIILTTILVIMMMMAQHTLHGVMVL